MPAGSVFEAAALMQGWTPLTQIEILLRYIDNQKSDDTFQAFIDELIDFEADVDAGDWGDELECEN